MCWERGSGGEEREGDKVKEGEGLEGCGGEKRKGEGRETEVGVGVVGEETRKKRYIYSMAAVKRTSGSNM